MRRFVLILALMPWASTAQAHKPSDSYIALSVQDERVTGQWDIALRDLDFAIGLDADGNGEITWGEVKAKRRDIIAYAMARLAITADEANCPITSTGELIDNHSDGAYAVLRFAATCPHKAKDLWVTYRLFFDIDPQHKGLLRLEKDGKTRTAIFGQIPPGKYSAWTVTTLGGNFATISPPASSTFGRVTTTFCSCFRSCCRL